MRENLIAPSDIPSTELIEKDNSPCIRVQSENGERLVNIYSLSPRDIAIVLLKTGNYIFSRYVKLKQQICTFEDLQGVFELKNQIEGITNTKIARIIKFIDPNNLFQYALGVTMYRNNFEGNDISLDQVIANFAICKEKRLAENKPLINPLEERKEENA